MDPDASSQQPPPRLGLRTERSGDHLDVVLEGPMDLDSPAAVADAVELVAQAVSDAGGPPLRLIADHPPTRLLGVPEAVADELGLTAIRDLLQLRVGLPLPADHPERSRAPSVATRPFDPAADGPAWVEVNDRAFSWHPDQGGRTLAQLHEQLAEPWVDLAGFLVLDDPAQPGRLIGSCWTRVHPATGDDPALGEIFVIGVDPAHHGRGLGAALVIAGLDHLAEQGLRTGMLYVEDDNHAARRLYERLGFTTHLRRRIRS